MEKSEHYDEIDLLSYFKIIWRLKLVIALIVASGVAGTAVISLFMMPVYEAKTVIIPAGVLSKDQSATTSLLAMQFGIAPPTTPASVEIVNLLKSNVLRERVIRRHNLLPLFFTAKQMRGKTENQLIWQGLRYLASHVSVSFSQKDNLITLASQFGDPNKAAEILGHILNELNNHMSSEAKRVADTNRHYLEAQLDKTADPFIKAKLYALIAQQIETSVMAEVKENFSFKVLDPPRVPDTRIRPKRASMTVMAFIISLFGGIFTAFIVNYVRIMRERSNMKDERGGTLREAISDN